MAIQFHAVLCLVAQRKGMVISMKRYYLILLALSLALFSCVCVRQETVPENNFSFYYLAEKINFQQDNGFIRKEMRNITGLDAEQMLALYLKGPQSQSLVSPFPNGVTLVEFSSDGSNAVVMLSLLDGKPTITMQKDQILLVDNMDTTVDPT